MTDLKELQEQLLRCENWLAIEPNDEEVKIKANLLKSQIQQIEAENNLSAKKSALEKQLQELKNKIDELQTTIKSSSRFTIIRGYEKECEAFNAIGLDICEKLLPVLKEKITQYNALYDEYKKLI